MYPGLRSLSLFILFRVYIYSILLYYVSVVCYCLLALFSTPDYLPLFI